MEPISITITGTSLADLAGKVINLGREMYVQQQMAQPQAPAVPAQPIAAQPIAPVAPVAPVASAQPQAPTVEPKYTLSDLQLAIAPLMDAGKQQELLQTLSAFGVQALTMLPEARYGEFATAIRQLGAKI